MLAEAQTDDLISEAPKPQADQSGEWKETSGEIQWVASETNDTNDKKEEEEEELDLNKGTNYSQSQYFWHWTMDEISQIFLLTKLN